MTLAATNAASPAPNAMSPAPEARPPVHPYDGVPLTVLSGIGRSGTTALRQALSLHPALDSTDLENNILLDLLDAAARNCTLPSRRYAMRVDQATYDAHFRALVLRLLWPRPRGGGAGGGGAYTNLTPGAADFLVRMWPGVRIVYLVRNGIEVVASRLRFESFRAGGVADHAETWRLAHRMALWGQARPDFLLVRHEWLLEPGGAERMIGAIGSFLGLPFHEPCAALLRERLVHPTSDGPERDAPARALRHRRERWATWSDADRRAFAERCREAMAYFGYDIPWEPAAVA